MALLRSGTRTLRSRAAMGLLRYKSTFPARRFSFFAASLPQMLEREPESHINVDGAYTDPVVRTPVPGPQSKVRSYSRLTAYNHR